MLGSEVKALKEFYDHEYILRYYENFYDDYLKGDKEILVFKF